MTDRGCRTRPLRDGGGWHRQDRADCRWRRLHRRSEPERGDGQGEATQAFAQSASPHRWRMAELLPRSCEATLT